jgi:signal transduction histidine kinase
VRIAVRDTGIGMSEAEVASAFRKFYRARNAATADVTGSGLGLAITRTILERHRSTITLVSTPGVGSEFAFELEVFDRPPAKPAPESDELPVIASTG